MQEKENLNKTFALEQTHSFNRQYFTLTLTRYFPLYHIGAGYLPLNTGYLCVQYLVVADLQRN